MDVHGLNSEDVALFDLDNTLCDHEGTLRKDLDKLMSPEDELYTGSLFDPPEYLRSRMDAIRSSVEWWADLPKFQLGFDVLQIARDLEYRIMILTQGNKRNPSSWMGKKRWVDKNLGQDTDLTITRDKSLMYGKVLVDDYPDYISAWLKHRPRGIVIMPAHDFNKDYRHERVIRYDGSNIREVREAMQRRLFR